VIRLFFVAGMFFTALGNNETANEPEVEMISGFFFEMEGGKQLFMVLSIKVRQGPLIR
jgi:hypothetical protein